MFQLPPPGVPHVWNDVSEPQQRKVELWARNGREFCESGDFHVTFGFILHAVNLRHGTDGFTSPPKEGALRIFSPEKFDGLNPQTWVPKASTLTSRPPKPLMKQYFSKVYSNRTTLEKVYSNETAHTELAALQLVKKYHLKFKPVQQNCCMNAQEFQSLICQEINKGQYNKRVHNCKLRCLQQKVTASDPECLVLYTVHRT